MLINLSNHPAYKIENKKIIYIWEEEQLNAVSQYGEIENLPFPNIPPEYTTEQVCDLAKDYLNRCVNLIQSSNNESAVHITGEMTFCFELIQLLLKKGYTCITSTTERIVEEKDGVKKSIYKFVRFRNYILL